MGKRVICLICAAVLLVMALAGIHAAASSEKGPPTEARLSKGIVKHAPNPLASAMFLVLAGVALTLLFDKKNRH